MAYIEKLDHHSENYNPQDYNGMDYNDHQVEMALGEMERQCCEFGIYCPKL